MKRNEPMERKRLIRKNQIEVQYYNNKNNNNNNQIEVQYYFY